MQLIYYHQKVSFFDIQQLFEVGLSRPYLHEVKKNVQSISFDFQQVFEVGLSRPCLHKIKKNVQSIVHNHQNVLGI